MKKKNRILVVGLTFSMVISSGLLTGCDSAAGNMGKETTGVEYEEADYELSEESCSDSGIDAADPGTVDNETEKTAETERMQRKVQKQKNPRQIILQIADCGKKLPQLRMESTRSL